MVIGIGDMLVETPRRGELHVRPKMVCKDVTALIYGERLVLSEVEGLVLKEAEPW
jgi:hypothetical protein